MSRYALRVLRRITKRDALVLGGTLLLWGITMWFAARAINLSAWDTPPWGRWDTGNYLSIARTGYVFEHCNGVANRFPTDYCGNSGWFPGYSYAIRVGAYLGPSEQVVGRLITFVALLVAWATLWFGFLRSRGAAGVLGMAIAAAFPSSVYYGAIFPVSIVVACSLLALVCIDRQRWLLAGVIGAVAAVSYSSGATLGILALVPFFSTEVGDLRTRIRAALKVGIPVAVGYVLVLLNFQRAVGHWDAWFKTQAAYHFEATLPPKMVLRQIRHIGNDGIPGIIGVQTIVISLMIAAAAWATYIFRKQLTLAERGVVVTVGALWFVPLTLGGDLSLYRAESLLVPVVILLTRLRIPVLIAFVALCIPVSYLMAKLFFQYVLI
ncbi:hypothetical protein BH10ACT2_BH10ACT2_00450 [soil metagenome]